MGIVYLLVSRRGGGNLKNKYTTYMCFLVQICFVMFVHEDKDINLCQK